jgi:hypothetical protein
MPIFESTYVSRIFFAHFIWMYHHAPKPTPRTDRLESTKLSPSLPEFPGPVKREPDSEVSSSLSYKKYVTVPPSRGNTVRYRRNNNHMYSDSQDKHMSPLPPHWERQSWKYLKLQPKSKPIQTSLNLAHWAMQLSSCSGRATSPHHIQYRRIQLLRKGPECLSPWATLPCFTSRRIWPCAWLFSPSQWAE